MIPQIFTQSSQINESRRVVNAHVAAITDIIA